MYTVNTMQRALFCVLATFALAGCPEDGTGPTEKKGASSGSPAKASGDVGPTSPAGAKLTDEQIDKEEIPTEQDFEQDAAKDVTADNYLDEIEKLAAEIEGDK